MFFILNKKYEEEDSSKSTLLDMSIRILKVRQTEQTIIDIPEIPFYKGTITSNGQDWITTSSPSAENYSSSVTEIDKNYGIENVLLYRFIQLDSKTEMPIVGKTLCDIPDDNLSSHRQTKTSKKIYICFYETDQKFEKIWKNPFILFNRFRECSAVIGPDFSVHNELPSIVQLHNIFRNKFLTALWQTFGITVIPNVSWTYKDYKRSFVGWPQDSIIAVNSTGVGRNPRSRELWLKGYKKMLKKLHPIHILRYGPKIRGEREDISTYYANNNKTSAAHGRE